MRSLRLRSSKRKCLDHRGMLQDYNCGDYQSSRRLVAGVSLKDARLCRKDLGFAIERLVTADAKRA